MFLLTLNKGMNFALPDVCNTPAPTGILPIPYPNISNPAEADSSSAAKNVIVDGAKALNLMSEISSSEGDEPGEEGGVISAETGGASRFLLGSTTVFINGAPAVRVTSEVGQNGEIMNCMGVSMVPTQTILLVLG